MAEAHYPSGQPTDFEHGHMDTHAQEMTFRAVMRLAKWGSLVIASLILFLAMWLCAKTGLLGALVTVAVVIFVGIMVLRERKGPGAH